MENSQSNQLFDKLRNLSQARIMLGRAGASLPTKHLLQFRFDHARARDAVYASIDYTSIAQRIEKLGLKTIVLNSNADTREYYLQNPNSGRHLSKKSKVELAKSQGLNTSENLISLTICDGLSAIAVNNHIVPVLEEIVQLVRTDKLFKLERVNLVKLGRVAIGDEIGSILNAEYNITLIGERPGLTSADSLGCYMSYKPNIGYTDDNRNCISNIRNKGLKPADAAHKIIYLIKEMYLNKQSGFMLKDRSEKDQQLT